jgi:hypothetical protein
MTYQETTALLLPFHNLAKWVTPLPSHHPCVLFEFFHLESKDQDVLKALLADNICGDISQEQLRGEIPIC